MNVLILITFFALAFHDDVDAAACNICGNGFACISKTQYFACDINNAIIFSSFTTCPGTGVCDNSINADLRTPCIPPGTPSCSADPVATPPPTTTTTTTTTTPSTTTTSTSTTTINPLTYWNTWCSTRAGGRYVNPNDATLRTYVYCYLNDGMKGAVYTCPGTLKFNAATSYCQ